MLFGSSWVRGWPSVPPPVMSATRAVVKLKPLSSSSKLVTSVPGPPVQPGSGWFWLVNEAAEGNTVRS